MTATPAPVVRLVCLDLAGTTVADRGLVESAFVEALDGTPAAADDAALAAALAHVRATMGRSKLEVFTELLGDPVAAAAANQRFEAAYERRIDDGLVAPIEGVPEALAELRRAGLRLCFTTGFSPATRDRLLAALGWQAVADLALSPADAGRGRPYPDMILTAVIRLGIEAVQQVAVAGDTTSDLLAGTRAGASVVAGVLTGAHDRATLASAPHTHLLESVVQLVPLVTSR